mgnify:CR=1 FL=1
MIKFKNTLKRLGSIGVMLRKGLQDELKAQKHNATGKLSRGLRYQVKDNVLNVISSVSYWKAVNNPKFAKKTNIEAIKRWVSTKGIPLYAAASILKKLNDRGYGKPYVYWTDGNTINRTDFAGYTARKFKKKVVKELAPAIGEDVADMISEQIKKNNPKTNVQRAF